MKNKNIVSALLLISFVLLGVLVPGGPIETRSFAHINPVILGAFNTFLTSLGIVSILLVYFVLKDKKWAFIVSAICGISYFLVYVLDLGKIFPVSPDSMPQVLLIIELVGTIASLPLMFFSILEAFKNVNNGNEQVADSVEISKKFVFLIVFLVIVGIGIVVFATKSAMVV
jgi:hypothetical protein